MSDITQLLQSVEHGDPKAAEELLPLVYDELRRLAAVRMTQQPPGQTIQHAHQKGIIHRDIKPGNVLVTMNDGVPHPMVIDFGIAKAINQKLTEKTLFTNFAQMIGTPAT